MLADTLTEMDESVLHHLALRQCCASLRHQILQLTLSRHTRVVEYVLVWGTPTFLALEESPRMALRLKQAPPSLSHDC
jgi:hypothetical protein